MDANHYNELIDLCQKIVDQANDSITNYVSAKYCGIGGESTREQLEDYLFIVDEVSAYLLGNAYALLMPESQEDALKTFNENVKRVISVQMKKAGGSNPPS